MEAEELNGTASSSTRPSSSRRIRTVCDQSLVQLQAAFFAEFAEDGKSVNCFLTSMSENFWEDDACNNYQQSKIHTGEEAPRRGIRIAQELISLLQWKHTIQTKTFKSLMQFFSPNKRPADPIANIGRKKNSKSLWGIGS
jgi:hypothetical protein